jgi:hypothetical protein
VRAFEDYYPSVAVFFILNRACVCELFELAIQNQLVDSNQPVDLKSAVGIQNQHLVDSESSGWNWNHQVGIGII